MLLTVLKLSFNIPARHPKITVNVCKSFCCHNTFFTLPDTDISKRKKYYNRRELVGYSMQQIYDVVADVKNYEHFLPYCKKSIVYNRTATKGKADIIMGFPPLCETNTSNLTFREPSLVKTESFDGRLFNHIQNYWAFSSGLKDIPNSCVVDLRITFEFKSLIQLHLSQMLFDLVIEQFEHSFLTEARRRYGPPTIRTRVLTTQKS